MLTRFIATVDTALATSVLVTGSTAAAGERAATAVVVGQTGTPGMCGSANAMWVQYATAGTPTYTVPEAGVITSVSHNANAMPGSIRAAFLGPAAAPGSRTVLAYTALFTVTPSTLNTFSVRLPVPAGAGLGIYTTAADMGCYLPTGAAGDVMAAGFGDPSASSDYTPGGTLPNSRINLSAVWEPDVDKDGYGDVSQDVCPQLAATQAACPAPETTLTKSPAKRSGKRKAKISFTSVAGATFTCAVDGKPAKPCTSPFKKRYGYGKHKVLVTAVSSVGIADPTPAAVKFRIVRRR